MSAEADSQPREVRLEERAVRRLSGVRVAAGNLWVRSPVEGEPPAPSVQLWVGQQPPVRVWAGSTVEVAGARWRVVEVVHGPGTTGHLTLRQEG